MVRFILSISLIAAGSLLLEAADAPKSEPAALKPKKALDETGDVVLDNVNFQEVQAFFKSRLKVPVTLDPTMTMQMDATTPGFSVVSRNAKYRDALRNVLTNNGLAYAVVGGGIVIGYEDVVLQRQLRQSVSLDAKDEALGTILKRYSDETGANLVLDPREAAKADASKITLKLDDVPLETAVRLAMEVGGLRVVRMNNVLFVTSDARADKLKDDGPAPNGAGIYGGGVSGGGVLIPPNAPLPMVIPPPPPPK